MSKMLRKKIEKVRDEFLLPGEQVVDATLAQPVGDLKSQVGMTQFGVIGAVVGHKSAKKDQEKIAEQTTAPATDFPPNGIVALTDQRLLVFKQSAMSGKPTEILVEYLRASVASMSCEEKKVTALVTIDFAEGETVTFEAIRSAKPSDFVDSFNA